MPTARKPKSDELKFRFRHLGRDGAWGIYWGNKRLMEVDPRLKQKKMLEVLIHESLHHYAPYLDEEAVTKLAKDLAGWVWAIGYRRLAL